MKKYRGYLLVLLIAFCIQGCSKQQDVEDHRFVLAMGFERLNEKKVLVRYSYADFDKAQSDSGTKIPSRSVTFLATSLKDANKKWKQYKSQQLNFGHLKVVLFANGKKDEKIIKGFSYLSLIILYTRCSILFFFYTLDSVAFQV